MPTYNYLCKVCGGIWEIFHPLDKPKPPCPRGCTNDDGTEHTMEQTYLTGEIPAMKVANGATRIMR